MQRTFIEKLKNWKEKPNRKPLILEGARQVGKTWLMKEFGRRYFSDVAYINFENNENLRTVFSGDLQTERLILALSAESGVSIKPQKTLIIFDEVQEVPRALTSLKYFCEDAPEYAIIAAGSQMGIALHHNTSFPVGKVELMKLYPLSFREYLLAAEQKPLVEMLDSGDWQMITPFKQKLIEKMKEYYYVGGMPEVVENFLQHHDWQEVRQLQNNLLDIYRRDFSKHAPATLTMRLNQVWNSLPLQLSKENKKFMYGAVKSGARAKDFELALLWLSDCGLIHIVHNVSKPGYPLKAYEEFDSFKVYMNDTGLLCALGQTDVKTILDDNKFFVEFKGALTEQYVLQQLKANCDLPIYYYSVPNSSGEIDFLLQMKDEIVPVEVKAAENLQAKSLKAFHTKWQNKFSVRTSLSDFRRDDWLTNIPLYAIDRIEKIIGGVAGANSENNFAPAREGSPQR